MKHLNNFKVFLLIVVVLNSLASCSNSSNSNEIDIPESYRVEGFYEGELIIKRVHKENKDDVVEYPATNQTILLKLKNEKEDIYDFLMPNFEWQDEEPRNINMEMVIKVDSKKEEASVEAFRSVGNNQVLPNSEMSLEGTIKGRTIGLEATFQTSFLEPSSYDYEAYFTGVKSDVTFTSYQFSFEEWIKVTPSNSLSTFEIPAPESGIMWSSRDYITAVLRDKKQVDRFSVYSHTKSVDGKKSAAIRTLEVDRAEAYKDPKILNGWLYNGLFSESEGKSKVGVPFKEEPLSVKGFFMYQPGKQFYRCSDINKPYQVELEEQTTDQFGIWMVLYEAEQEEYLSLDSFLTSDKVIGVAEFISSKEVTSFEPFEAVLKYRDGKSYDTNKDYKVAVLLTSSKDGVSYSGAVGSELVVDNLEITTKK